MGRPKKAVEQRARNTGFTAYPDEIAAIKQVADELGMKSPFDYVRFLINREAGRRVVAHHRLAVITRVGGAKSGTASSWAMMRYRCYNPKSRDFARYGGRGIYVCEYLRESHANLEALIGPRPLTMSIDRINSGGSYTCGECPECIEKGAGRNVRWATAIGQAQNQGSNVNITIDGTTKCLAAWARFVGISECSFARRVKSGLLGLDLLAPSKRPRRTRSATRDPVPSPHTLPQPPA